MSTLRLQPIGLSEPDVARLQVFLRFIGKTARGQWVLVRDGAADLLICAAATRGFVPPDPHSEVAVLSERQDRDDGLPRDITLPRILDLETFQELLSTVESRMVTAAAPAAAVARCLPASPVPPPPPVRLTTLAPPDVPQARRDRTLDGRFRLVRWPGAELMRSHPKSVRLLGFLACEAMSLDELAPLSGLDRAACAAILQQLLQRDLLVPQALAAVTGVPSKRAAPRPGPPTADVRPHVAAPPDPSRGLLSRLRSRLGLS